MEDQTEEMTLADLHRLLKPDGSTATFDTVFLLLKDEPEAIAITGPGGIFPFDVAPAHVFQTRTASAVRRSFSALAAGDVWLQLEQKLARLTSRSKGQAQRAADALVAAICAKSVPVRSSSTGKVILMTDGTVLSPCKLKNHKELRRNPGRSFQPQTLSPWCALQ